MLCIHICMYFSKIEAVLIVSEECIVHKTLLSSSTKVHMRWHGLRHVNTMQKHTTIPLSVYGHLENVGVCLYII